MRCNCENAGCDHGQHACTRDSDPQCRIMYVGEVCPTCYHNMPTEYHLSDEGEPIEDTIAPEGSRCGKMHYPGNDPENGPAEPCLLTLNHKRFHKGRSQFICHCCGENLDKGILCAKCEDGTCKCPVACTCSGSETGSQHAPWCAFFAEEEAVS